MSEEELVLVAQEQQTCWYLVFNAEIRGKVNLISPGTEAGMAEASPSVVPARRTTHLPSF